MARFHSVTWQDGSFESTAYVLSFDSKAARTAYIMQCDQRLRTIRYAECKKLLSEGFPHVLILWDSSKPLKFVQVR